MQDEGGALHQRSQRQVRKQPPDAREQALQAAACNNNIPVDNVIRSHMGHTEHEPE